MHSSLTHPLCRVLLSGALLASLSGCDDPLSPQHRQVGVIAFYGDPVMIAVYPDTVVAGRPFVVSVRSYGNGCISKDKTEIEADNLFVDITPYDVHSGASVCSDILNQIDHVANLSFAKAGTALIRFHGKQLPADLPITETREVVVK